MGLFEKKNGVPGKDEALVGGRRPSGVSELSGLPGSEGYGAWGDEGPALLIDQSARIGTEEVRKAAAVLRKYKDGKANLERRVVEDERWYKLRHWELLRRTSGQQNPEPEPASAWLFNSLMNKHADAMDNYPEATVLPREPGDKESASAIGSILPVVLERNEFEDTYSNCWWKKLKHGAGVYGVFWNATLENGLGDIDIKPVDLLNLFWEPGINDIQDSRNVFHVHLEDNDLLEEAHPELKGKLGGDSVDVAHYVYDDRVDTSEKSVVVDWYYKAPAANGRKLLQYVQFVGDTVLFSSEDYRDPETGELVYRERGWYDHGEYPFVFDTLFPEEGSPAGFGLIAITKDPQLYIDKLSAAVLQYADLAARPRYFISEDAGINEEEFLDSRNPMVHVAGSLDERKIQPVQMPQMDSIVVTMLQMKQEELKETSANRDVSQGSTGGGVTAASAISALQEAGNKSSRDMIAASFRAYTRIDYLCIELMRQFYDEARSFRITGKDGNYDFTDFSNAQIREAEVGADSVGTPLFRRPVFDVKVKAAKRSPFSRISQNEMAKELYGLGFFNPERAQEALGALQMMEFEGKDDVMEQVQQGQTLLNLCQQMGQQVDQMAGLLQELTGMDMGVEEPAAGRPQAGGSPAGGGVNARAAQAEKRAVTPFMERLAARSTPDMDTGGGV